MIRNLFHITVIGLCLSLAAVADEVEQFGIGEEYIQPLRYPKFSLSFDYSMARRFHGTENSLLRAKLPNNLAGTVSFEAGLYKYFNAGALFSLNFPTSKANFEPLHLRFTIFGKPYIALTDRIGIFSRLGTGLSVSLLDYLTVYRFKKDREFNDFMEQLDNTYAKQDYAWLPVGVNAMATIGIEAFPFERLGLALEWGLRGDFFYASKSRLLQQLIDKPEETRPVPNALKYLVYETPIMLTLHIIL